MVEHSHDEEHYFASDEEFVAHHAPGQIPKKDQES